MQNIMKQAQKMQKELMKTQEELEKREYEGSSSLVKIKMNGKHEILSVKIDAEDGLAKEDMELLEDMIMVAFNDAISQAEKEKEAKLSKYGSLSGLM